MKNISSESKQKVNSFRKEFQLREITYQTLTAAFERQGFTVIEFNPVINDPDVAAIIKNLHLEQQVLYSKGFLYTDANYRLVFVNEKLNEDEKTLVLAHEQGHYYCGHASSTTIVGRDVQEEHEANEFVHYLMKKSTSTRIKTLFAKHKKHFLAAALAIILALAGTFSAIQYHDKMIYEGHYYVTENGQKYHLKNCVTIQGSKIRRMTKKDVETGIYEPCSVCMPDSK